MKKYNGIKGITLIALVVTIIVLLLIAGISISMLTGPNGILNRATEAKNEMIIEKEKEAIALAWNKGKIDSTVNISKSTPELLESELISSGNNVTVSYAKDDGYLIFFIDTEHSYKIDDNGNVRDDKTKSYSITYKLNGGKNADGQPNQFIGGTTVKLLNPKKDNAYFDGWYESSDFSTERVSSVSGEKDIILYAKWIDETPSEYFTWSTTENSATINGFSDKGLQVYNEGKLSIMAVPREYNDLPVTAVKNKAFEGKIELSTLILPDSTNSLGQAAFGKCTGLKEITLPISLYASDSHGNIYSSNIFPFYEVKNVRKVNFTKGTGEGYSYSSSSYDYTPWCLSRNVEGGLEVTFEEGITSIGNYMFYNCQGISSNMQDIFLNNMNSIGTYAFYNCTGLKNEGEKIVLDKEVTIGAYAFYNCAGLTGSLEINTNIGDGQYIFANCTGLNELILGEKVKKVEKSTFEGCTGIERLKISDKMEKLGQAAFGKCTGLKEITLPISLYASDSHGNIYSSNIFPFYEVKNVRKVNFTKGTGEGYSYSSSSYDYTPWCLSRNVEGGLEVTLEEGITSIGNYMFYNCSGIKKITYRNTIYTSLSTFKSNFAGNIGQNALNGIGLET